MYILGSFVLYMIEYLKHGNRRLTAKYLYGVNYAIRKDYVINVLYVKITYFVQNMPPKIQTRRKRKYFHTRHSLA